MSIAKFGVWIGGQVRDTSPCTTKPSVGLRYVSSQERRHGSRSYPGRGSQGGDVIPPTSFDMLVGANGQAFFSAFCQMGTAGPTRGLWPFWRRPSRFILHFKRAEWLLVTSGGRDGFKSTFAGSLARPTGPRRLQAEKSVWPREVAGTAAKWFGTVS